ncbi:hypothetical protein GCM10027359_18210 [Marilutibacter aestuarii]
MLMKAIGSVVVYGFALYGLGGFLKRVHAVSKAKPQVHVDG